MCNAELRIISFGYGHPGTQPPKADLTLDVRDSLRDPHIRPEFRQLTGMDDAVREHLCTQLGVVAIIDMLDGLRLVAEPIARHAKAPVTVAFGCVGGRHRSVVLAELLAHAVRGRAGWAVEVEHRDLHRPVLKR